MEMATEKNSIYWEKRIAAGTWKTYNSLEEKNRDLLEFYVDASEQIKKELYLIAEKYSKDGVLSLSDMHKKNRLTDLNQKFQDIIEDLGHKTEKSVKKNMRNGFKAVYENTAVGMGDEDFSMPNKKLMEKLLNEPWRGDSFSGRLWKNQKKLAVGLNDLLLTGLQQGKTATEIAVSLHNFMGQGFNECHRLVRTETMHYLNDATLRRYKDAGIKYVQIWAAEDERTCDECSKYHGKIYPIDKCPHVPLHPNCRCTIIPVTDESMIEAYEKRHVKGASGAKRNTNTPVKFNEKYSYDVILEDMSENINKSISICTRKVAMLGSKDGNEHMYLVNMEDGKQAYYEKGDSAEVGGPEFWSFIDKHKNESFIFIHNHNTDGYFSETDLRTLLRTDQISAMIAVRNDAIIYVAEKGGKLPNTGSFDDLFKDEIEQLNADVRSGKVEASERNLKREEIIVDGLLRLYTKAGRLVEINGQK